MIESKLKARREIRLTIGESTGILQIPDDFAKIELIMPPDKSLSLRSLITTKKS